MALPPGQMKAFAQAAKQKHGGGGQPQKGGGAPPGGGGGGKKDAKATARQVEQQVAAGKIDGQLRKLMKGYDPEEGYPDFARDEEKWAEAERQVQPEGHGKDHGADPWLIVAHVYKALGGRVVPGAQPTDGKGDADRDGGDEGEDEKKPPQPPKKKDKGGDGGPPQKGPKPPAKREESGGEEPDGDEGGGEARGDHEEPDGDEPDGEVAALVEKAARAVEQGDDEDAERLGKQRGEGDAAPAWAKDGDLWHKARAAVDPEGEGADLYDDPWAVVAATYKLLGGEVAPEDGDAGERGGEESEADRDDAD